MIRVRAGLPRVGNAALLRALAPLLAAQLAVGVLPLAAGAGCDNTPRSAA